MRDATKFYIDGEWVEPLRPDILDVINPATEHFMEAVGVHDDEPTVDVSDVNEEAHP